MDAKKMWNLLCRCRGPRIKTEGKIHQFFGRASALSNFFLMQEIHLAAIPVPSHRSPNMLDASNLWDGVIRIDTVSHDLSRQSWWLAARWISEYLPTTLKGSFLIKNQNITNLAMATGPLVIFGWLFLLVSKTARWHCDRSSKAGSFQRAPKWNEAPPIRPPFRSFQVTFG